MSGELTLPEARCVGEVKRMEICLSRGDLNAILAHLGYPVAESDLVLIDSQHDPDGAVSHRLHWEVKSK